MPASSVWPVPATWSPSAVAAVVAAAAWRALVSSTASLMPRSARTVITAPTSTTEAMTRAASLCRTERATSTAFGDVGLSLNPRFTHLGESSSRLLWYGKLDHERRRLVGQRLHPHAPAVGLHEAAHDRQAEPRAARAGAVERLEDPLLVRLGHAGTAIDDADQDAAADVPRAHRHRVAPRVALRVLEQVRERALELGGVGLDRRQVAVD